MNAIDKLNEAAGKFVEDYDKKYPNCSIEHYFGISIGFEAGALSPEAANGCNKHVEEAKINALIAENECMLKLLGNKENANSKAILIMRIDSLKKQLETLKQQP